MRPPGGGEAAAAGPARFQCPEDFAARRFAFCPQSLEEAPGKRLLLITAPADFRPESLSGHRLALLGSPLLRAPQPDGGQKVYSLRASREESATRLLIAAAHAERLTCAQPFGASLRIQESPGDPDAPRALFPVAERPPPRVPEGLRQRFFPFGARVKGPPPASEAAGKAARRRGKKRPLLPLKQAPWQPEGPEQRPLKEEHGAAAILPVLGGRLLLGRDARPSGRLEEAPEVDEPDRRAGEREKQRETEELPDPTSRYWQPEGEPWLQGGGEPEGGGGDCAGEPAGCKARKRAEGLWGAAAIKEEPLDIPCLGSLPEETLRALGEDPAGEATSCKKRKKKKERSRERLVEGLWGAAAIKEEPLDIPCLGSLPEETLRTLGEDPAGEATSCKKRRRKKKERSRERLAEGLWGAAVMKEEPLDVPCLGSILKEDLGSPREEPAREFAGYIKQSPGKGEGGLWDVVALKEELGDVPSLGSLAGGSLGVSPENTAGGPSSCKKKKKRKSKERGGEGLWGAAAIKEEPGDISCLGSLLEEGLGSARGGLAGELLACKKEKGGKLDKELLQEQKTETQLDVAAPLWQEAGPEEPLQTGWASPSPKKKKKKKKKGRRREGEDQAGLFAAGT